jgi:hypothetical protein
MKPPRLFKKMTSPPPLPPRLFSAKNQPLGPLITGVPDPCAAARCVASHALSAVAVAVVAVRARRKFRLSNYTALCSKWTEGGPEGYALNETFNWPKAQTSGLRLVVS